MTMHNASVSFSCVVMTSCPGERRIPYASGDMLREAGHEVTEFCPIFAPDDAAVAAMGQYDFVTCTEVAEHFHRPAQEFDTMVGRRRA